MACETQAAIIEVVDGDQELRMGDVEGRSSSLRPAASSLVATAA
jgi:hypothetical protein